MRGKLSSSAACGFALILLRPVNDAAALHQLGRKERKENNARLITRLKVFLFFPYKGIYAKYFGPPLRFTRFTFDVSVTHACTTSAYLWIEARMKMKTSAYC